MLFYFVAASYAITAAWAIPVDDNLFPRDTAQGSGFHPLDFAPDFSHDPFPPFPSIKDKDGKNLTAENWRGTRLFGFDGCTGNEMNAITTAWTDFHTLASQDGVYQNIDWNSQAAKEFFGHATEDKKKITQQTKDQIQSIFKQAQQMYDPKWAPPYSGIFRGLPWVSWETLWVRVSCAPDGDETNFCGDKPYKDPEDGTCRSPYEPGQKYGKMEAYSEVKGKDGYSHIVFCKRFSNDPELLSLGQTIDIVKGGGDFSPNQLWDFQNQARVMFHEVTHLSYFMNTPAKAPEVIDLRIDFKPLDGGKPVSEAVYGPELVKILANYEAVNAGGMFTQRNADSYAWFAMAKYAEKIFKAYPQLPNEKRKPLKRPRDHRGKAIKLDQLTDNDIGADSADDQAAGADLSTKNGRHHIPPCPGIRSPASALFGIASIAQGKAVCDDKNALSGVPFNVFGSEDTGVFAQFCSKLKSQAEFKMTVDSRGYSKTPTPSKLKRTPPPNAAQYDTFNFNLAWNPANGGACIQDFDSCLQAFATLVRSPCGHQGGEQNTMVAAAKFDLPSCGAYSYTITGPKVPKPAAPQAAAPVPSVGPVSCNPAGSEASTVDDKSQSVFADVGACANTDRMMSSTSSPINYRPANVLQGNQYQYDVTWVPGCSLAKEFNIAKPIASDPATCSSLLQKSYKDCKNGGRGGSITAGCLKYSFSVGPKP